MIALESMLLDAAIDAGIAVPEIESCELEQFDHKEYPRWYIFCLMQLGQPTPYHGVHFENAKVIAEIKDEEIASITPEIIVSRGFQIGYSH